MKLVIVESPTKAHTIARFLKDDYEVRASVGHIRDLPKSNKKAIDIPGGFIPHYEVVKGKEKIINELKALTKLADEVYLTTDPDREGESIAWHLKEILKLKNPKRVVFHEITEEAVKDAFLHARTIDENLRMAQEARRVLDRLFGYDLSGLIWKKVRYGLSAGRVQSPALRILVEREREIQQFIPEIYWAIQGVFTTEQKKELTLICETEPREEKETERILTLAKKSEWHIKNVTSSEAKRSPRAPFITSTLQQTASTRLGFSPSRTMGIAQKLYEEGLITYMRTDSTALSKTALGEIYGTIKKTFGEEYLAPRTYATKSKSAQEAHEAIRPTHASQEHGGKNEEQKKLYTLIRERTLASQMSDARLLKTKITANIKEGSIPDFSATGSIVIFPGWLSADPRARGDDTELPKTNEGEYLTLKEIESEQKQTEPPPRYTEAGLVKELEKREIGRPSTYASILKTLLDRLYVTKEGKALRPTDTGEVVSLFLETHFGNYISDSFTAEMENDLDEIAEGKRDYTKTLKEFYGPFSKEVKSKESLDKATTLGEADKIHRCPLCGKSMMIKLGKTGKFLSCSNFPECLGARTIDGKELEPPKETGVLCPKCTDGKLIQRKGYILMIKQVEQLLYPETEQK